MTHNELIAALSSAPVGTRELGVAVLEAIGCRCMHARRLDAAGSLDTEKWWEDAREQPLPVTYGTEARVVTDLNFRLPGVPEGAHWTVLGPDVNGFWAADLRTFGKASAYYEADAYTERLARCIAELKAVLAVRGA